jgi:hypothetical protein
MTPILVFTTFVSFFVVERFSNKEAAKHELQSAFRAETAAGNVRQMGTSMNVSNQASQEAPEHQFQPRTANDRRRGERRGQSAA